MELIENLEHILATFVEIIQLIIETASVLCVLAGFVLTVPYFFTSRRPLRDIPFLPLRIRFGSWLALALEFQLAADILATTVAPSFQALGRLGAIALIRTFLNYFLNKELEAETEIQERKKTPSS